MSALAVDPMETSPSLATIAAAVDVSLSAFRGRSSPDGMVTVAVTDSVGSTAMVGDLGERALTRAHAHPQPPRARFRRRGRR